MIQKIFNPGTFSNNVNFALLIIRLVSGAFMLTHGYGKFLYLLGDDQIIFPDPLGVGATASLALTVFAEVFCALFLIFGFATRLAALPLLITMLVAAFVVHASDGFGKQELPLLYAASYLVLAITGAGKISIDKWIYDKISNY